MELSYSFPEEFFFLHSMICFNDFLSYTFFGSALKFLASKIVNWSEMFFLLSLTWMVKNSEPNLWLVERWEIFYIMLQSWFGFATAVFVCFHTKGENLTCFFDCISSVDSIDSDCASSVFFIWPNKMSFHGWASLIKTTTKSVSTKDPIMTINGRIHESIDILS